MAFLLVRRLRLEPTAVRDSMVNALNRSAMAAVGGKHAYVPIHQPEWQTFEQRKFRGADTALSRAFQSY